MDPIILRAGERILAVFIGGLSMFLGYHLFLNVSNPTTDSEGNFVLPGGISIYLSRVGPGVFFALFGAIIVALSIYSTITYSVSFPGGSSTEQPQISESSIDFVGVGGAKTEGDRQALEKERLRLQQQIFFLNNTLPTILREHLSPERQVDLQLAIPNIKLSLMKTVWDEDWGDYLEFEALVLNGELDTAHQGFEKTINYYRHGQERKSQ